MQWLSRAAPAAGPARVRTRQPFHRARAAASGDANGRACGTLPGRLASHRHNGSSQAAAPGRSGSLPDNFCMVDQPSAGGRTAPRRAEPSRACTGSPRKNPTRRNWSARLQARHAAPFCTEVRRSPATMPHPFHCVTTITITCIGTDAALPCPELLFEKPPWMKIASRASQAVRSICWPNGCGSDTQAAARHWQATPARPKRRLPRRGHLATSSS